MLPHIQNSEAGRNHYDPFHSSLFEVYFSIPDALQAEFGKDVNIMTEHVKSVDGLNTLDVSPAVVTQKFLGVTRSYMSPHLDETSHEITVVLVLNLRNQTDNYVYKMFRAWNKLNYDLSTGAITTKKNYIAPWLRVAIGNREGTIIREVIYKDVMLSGVELPGQYAYDSNEPVEMSVKFKSDWAQDLVI